MTGAQFQGQQMKVHKPCHLKLFCHPLPFFLNQAVAELILKRTVLHKGTSVHRKSWTMEAKLVRFFATQSKYSWLNSVAAAELVKSEKRRNTVNKEDRNERRELGQEDLQIRQRH